VILFFLMSKNILSKKVCVALMATGFLGISGVYGGSPGISQSEFSVALGESGVRSVARSLQGKTPRNKSERLESCSALYLAVRAAVSARPEEAKTVCERGFGLLSAMLSTVGPVFPSESVLEVLGGVDLSSGPFSKGLEQISLDVVTIRAREGGHHLADEAILVILFVVMAWGRMVSLCQDLDRSGVAVWLDDSHAEEYVKDHVKLREIAEWAEGARRGWSTLSFFGW
jgi:hypothetical protein